MNDSMEKRKKIKKKKIKRSHKKTKQITRQQTLFCVLILFCVVTLVLMLTVTIVYIIQKQDEKRMIQRNHVADLDRTERKLRTYFKNPNISIVVDQSCNGFMIQFGINDTTCFCHPKNYGKNCEFKSNYPAFANQKTLLERGQFHYGDTWLYNIDPLKFDDGDAQIFLDNLPKEDKFPDCKVCSVVGSSKNLKNHYYGKNIDSADCVFRINNPPLRFYTRFVGEKTTYTSVNHFALRDLQNKSITEVTQNVPGAKLIVHVRTPHWIDHINRGKRLNPYPNDYYIMDPLSSARVYEHFLRFDSGGETFPTTGLITIYWAMYVCEKVNVYGFYDGMETKKYYSRQSPDPVHNLQLEYILNLLWDLTDPNFTVQFNTY